MLKKASSLVLLSTASLLAATDAPTLQSPLPPMQGDAERASPVAGKCECCESFRPQYYDLQCDWGFAFGAEFLYWYAGETDLPLATRAVKEVSFTTGAPLTRYALFPQEYVSMDTDWDPGFRIGVGGNDDSNGWDWWFSWTYLHNTSKRSVKTDPLDFVSISGTNNLGHSWFVSPYYTLYTQISAGATQGPNFTAVRGKWKLCYNVLDLEVGRRYWLSQQFNLRPFIGLRGAWTTTRYKVTNLGTYTESNIYRGLDNRVALRNNNWGVGFLAGIDPTLHFTPCFALYGRADLALLWGQDKLRRSESVDIEQVEANPFVLVTDSYRMKGNISGMQPMMDLSVGLRYENTFCSNRYQMRLDLGWEHHHWFNEVHRFLFVPNAIQGSSRGINYEQYEMDDLGVGGLVLRFRLDI